MTQRNRNDAILVRFITFEDDKEKLIASYYTTAFEQTLKMFITARDYDIECWFNDLSAVVEDSYKQMSYMVEEVNLTMGSSEDMPTIEVII